MTNQVAIFQSHELGLAFVLRDVVVVRKYALAICRPLATLTIISRHMIKVTYLRRALRSRCGKLVDWTCATRHCGDGRMEGVSKRWSHGICKCARTFPLAHFRSVNARQPPTTKRVHAHSTQPRTFRHFLSRFEARAPRGSHSFTEKQTAPRVLLMPFRKRVRRPSRIHECRPP